MTLFTPLRRARHRASSSSPSSSSSRCNHHGWTRLVWFCPSVDRRRSPQCEARKMMTMTTTATTTTTTTTTAMMSHKMNKAHARSTVVRRAGDDQASSTTACTGSCDSCGLAKDKMQCDGSGRIQGGLAAIPLFSWWPIKAYRPCPGLISSGGVYTRAGQDVNSILWGENGGDSPPSRK